MATRLHAVLAVGEAAAVHAVQRSRTLSNVELHAPTPKCLDVHELAAQDRQGDDEVAVRRVNKHRVRNLAVLVPVLRPELRAPLTQVQTASGEQDRRIVGTEEEVAIAADDSGRRTAR